MARRTETPLVLARRRLGALETERTYWEPAWKQLRKYLASQRGFFPGDLPNRGNREDDTLVDMTPARALRTLGAGMHSGVTNPSRPWLRLMTHDPELSEYREVRAWLDDVAKILLRIFARSNVYSVLPGIYGEKAGFGTAAMLVEEDFNTVIRCRPFTIGSYVLDNDENLRVNTFGRSFWMTTLQIVDKFELENCPRQVADAYRNDNMTQWFEVKHLIEPRKGKATGLNRMPVESKYWVKGSGEDDPNGGFLQKSGYEEFPVMAPRWETIGSDVYGKESPGWVGLGDSMMLQTQQEDRLEATDKINNPPVNAPASMMASNVSLLPGAVNWTADNTPGVAPVASFNPDLNALMAGIQDTRAQVNEAFFVDLFMMFNNLTGPERTAREIAERSSEKLLMLGPVLQRTYSELLDPLINRTFNIAMRAGIFPPPPEELQDTEIRVEYTNVLSQAQRMVGTTAMEQFAGFVGNLAKVAPESLDKVDFDQTIDEYGEALGVPARLIVSDDVVQQKRQERAKQMAAQQQMAAMQQGAATAADLGKVNVGDNNALEALLQGAQA